MTPTRVFGAALSVLVLLLTPGSVYAQITACPSVAIAPVTIANTVVGTAYKASFTASGGLAPYSYSIDKLPPGLTLSVDVLSGTPTTAGTFPFTVTAIDANKCPGSRNYAIVVCPAIAVGPAAVPNALVGTGYKTGFSASGGLAPYSYSIAGSIPPGLTLSVDVLSGTPTTAGTFRFTVTASDANRCTSSNSYTIVVCPAIAIAPVAVANAVVGTAYKAGFSASGGLAPYSYSITGSVPPGLTLSGDVLFGTPTTAGTFLFTATASDANKCSGSTSYTIVVDAGCPVIAVGPAAVANAVVETPYKTGFTASGGLALYSYAITGIVPPGLTLSGDVLFGTPTTAGTFTFTVTAPFMPPRTIWRPRSPGATRRPGASPTSAPSSTTGRSSWSSRPSSPSTARR